MIIIFLNIKKHGCDDNKSKFFIRILNLVGKQINADIPVVNKIHTSEKIKERANAEMRFSESIDEFFNSSFFKKNNENHELYKVVRERFLKKTYCFYTHAVYQMEGNTREHSLALLFIEFSDGSEENYIPCRFYTGTILLVDGENLFAS